MEEKGLSIPEDDPHFREGFVEERPRIESECDPFWLENLHFASPCKEEGWGTSGANKTQGTAGSVQDPQDEGDEVIDGELVVEDGVEPQESGCRVGTPVTSQLLPEEATDRRGQICDLPPGAADLTDGDGVVLRVDGRGEVEVSATPAGGPGHFGHRHCPPLRFDPPDRVLAGNSKVGSRHVLS